MTLQRFRLMRAIFEIDPKFYKTVCHLQINDQFFDFENDYFNGEDVAPSLKWCTVWGMIPLVYYCTDYYNDTPAPACAECASLSADGRIPVGVDQHEEGAPIECEFCGAMIESAYGDPDDEGNDDDSNA